MCIIEPSIMFIIIRMNWDIFEVDIICMNWENSQFFCGKKKKKLNNATNLRNSWCISY